MSGAAPPVFGKVRSKGEGIQRKGTTEAQMQAGHLHHFKEQMRSAAHRTFRERLHWEKRRDERKARKRREQRQRKEEALCL